jgi:hypothetical protein
MIEYDNNDSPFSLANKNYCEKLEANFQAAGIHCSGDCNSFGYDVQATFTNNSHTYKLKCYKYQITRDGVVIPVNAAEYLGIEVKGAGFNKNMLIQYGRNYFRRLFMHKKRKEELPYPFYFHCNTLLNEFQTREIFKFLSYYKIVNLKLKNGKLRIKIFSAFTNPAKIAEDIEAKRLFEI